MITIEVTLANILMNMTSKHVVIALLSTFILNSIVTVDKDLSLVALADSPRIGHQEIKIDSSNWTQSGDVPSQNGTVLPDGRKIYYKTANDIADCKGIYPKNIDIIGTLPNIESVGYLSDGQR